MPGRKEILSTGNIYHVFNKFIEAKTIFNSSNYCSTLLELLFYYRSTKISCSYSRFRQLNIKLQTKILKNLKFKKHFKIDLLAFCLMPTHFHFLIKQKINNGISKYLSDVFNAFTRYHNLKNARKGPLFISRFKAVLIRSEKQLIHVSRYIHLNPYSTEFINTIKELADYPWSSYKEYVGNAHHSFCEINTIMSLFYDRKKRYQQFVENHADYQKTLEYTKHAEKW